MSKRIVYTSHAILRRFERDISEKDVEFVISKPDYVRTNFDGRKIATRRIGDRTINVIYLEKENLIRVITVY